MSGWSYVRGPHPAILHGRTMVALAGDGATERARALLTSIGDETTLETVLEVLIADGIGHAPDFFVGQVDGGSLSAFLRGSATVTIEDERWHRSTLDARQTRTWHEIALDGVARFVVGFDEQEERPDLRAASDGELDARPGPLGIAAVFYRAAEPTARLMTLTGAPVPEQTLDFTDGFPDDLFAPVTDDAAPQAPAPQAAAPVVAPVAADARFDDLFGATGLLGVEAAAVRAEPEEQAAPAQHGTAGEASAELPGLLCPQGHPNPPTRETCAVCGARIGSAQVATVGRPQLGAIVLPDGRRIAISETMIIGRSPRSERTGGSALPTLVKLDGAPGDVSRNHARVFVEGWNVLVEDLGSANGTVVLSPDGSSRRLRSGESALLTRGAALDLGGVRLSVEDVP